jgi:putative addiction module killer protein
MESRERQLKEYIARTGSNPFGEWLHSITDKTTRARIRTRLSRLRLGNFGDCRGVGEGVNELRLDFGPGYRVYYGLVGERSSCYQVVVTRVPRTEISEKPGDTGRSLKQTMPTRDYKESLFEDLNTSDSFD